ncbi:ABC transporter ATP-binding protein [Candidatus Thiosymbion oneisti]|uniref:ABC transporter ATP-binding protein n=1 Tax=Candidatus Thiosymbion oneisti TaxID=589554 RepID=UPI000B7CD145|nr:ABC transporter ATP-binding protein [Candidatus Thiosymbion oneisti]
MPHDARMTRQMMNGIATEATRLRKAIETESVGFQSRVLSFVRDYSADADLERAAIMANLKLSTLTGAARDAVKQELYDLIDRVLAAYSPQAVQKLAARREYTDLDETSRYLDRKTIAYRCCRLTRSFGKSFTLGPIDLTLRRGDIAGVVGENGNGKTTLFRLIAGELAADGGELEYPGLDASSTARIDWPEVKSRIAYVPQELPRWRGHLKQILQYEAAIHGIRGAENDYEVDFIVERLGLGAHLGKRWRELSGGYKFRFALARALVWRPELMILDEPLANLDVNAQLAVLRDIKAMATNVSHPIAVFISSQHLHEIEAIADRILFLRKGEASFNDRRVRLGDDRQKNVFELACELPVPALQAAIGGRLPLPVPITQDGLHYTLTTETDVSATDVLQILLETGVRIQYFRDISRSTKGLFRSPN